MLQELTVKHFQIPDIESVHELHVWRLNEHKAIASAHVVVSDDSVASFIETARHVNECLHAYGVHSVTLQPERPVRSRRLDRKADQASPPLGDNGSVEGVEELGRVACHGPHDARDECQLVCARVCEGLTCCKVNREPVD